MSEHDQTAAVVKWFKLAYPKYKECIIGIPNGAIVRRSGKGNMFAMIAKLKKEGVKTGTSDLFIAVPMGGKHGLWVEMKDEGKTLSRGNKKDKDQWDHLDLMSEMGYEGIWCAGFDVAKAAIEVYMNEE